MLCEIRDLAVNEKVWRVALSTFRGDFKEGLSSWSGNGELR
jgi:hypothetical protein